MQPRSFTVRALCLALALSGGLAAAPPPRDAGPARFVPPPPREPLLPERAEPGPAAPVSRQIPSSGAPLAVPAISGNGTQLPQPSARQARGTTPRATVSAAASAKFAYSANETNEASPPPKTAPLSASAAPAPEPTASAATQVPAAAEAIELTPAGADFLVTQFDRLPEKRGLAEAHYPASNEYRIDLFRNFVADLGGGYAGVGTDQNLTLIAWARSSHAWLVDFDPVSVGINRIHLYFLARAETFAEFRRLWSSAERKRSAALIADHFQGDPYLAQIQRAFAVAHEGAAPVPLRFREMDALTKRHGLRSFHNDPGDYAYLRGLALAGRIQALPGDIRGRRSLAGVYAAAGRLVVPLRVLYLSNAEDYFGSYPAGFRANMLALPGDEKSVILRTVSRKNYVYGQPPGEKFPAKAPFHYNVQTMDSLKAWLALPRPLSVLDMLDIRRPQGRGFSLTDKKPPVRAREPAGAPGARSASGVER